MLIADTFVKKVPTLLYNIHCIIKRVLVTIPMFICKVNLGATIIRSILWSNMCSYFFERKFLAWAYLILLFVYLNLIFRKLQIMYFEETHNQRSIQIKKKQVWHKCWKNFATLFSNLSTYLLYPLALSCAFIQYCPTQAELYVISVLISIHCRY